MGKIRLGREGCWEKQDVCTTQGYPVISSVFSKKKRHSFVPFKTMSLDLMVVAHR